jgi:hypothetical protein
MTLGAIVLVGACSGLVGRGGEGPVTSETRPVAPFARVDVNNGIRLTLRIDPGLKIGATQPVEVSAQQNLLPIIKTEILGDTLRVHSSEGFRTSERVEVTIVTSALQGVTLSGGSNGTVDGLDADQFQASLSGGSVLTASGVAQTLTITASGGSRTELDGLTAATATVDASGGSRINLRATGTVSGSASGGSHVSVAGGATLNVTSTGGSQVTTR